MSLGLGPPAVATIGQTVTLLAQSPAIGLQTGTSVEAPVGAQTLTLSSILNSADLQSASGNQCAITLLGSNDNVRFAPAAACTWTSDPSQTVDPGFVVGLTGAYTYYSADINLAQLLDAGLQAVFH